MVDEDIDDGRMWEKGMGGANNLPHDLPKNRRLMGNRIVVFSFPSQMLHA